MSGAGLWTCPDCLSLMPLGEKEDHRRHHQSAHAYVEGGSKDLVIRESDDIHTVTIFGIKYSLELFRLMATADIGRVFKILARRDGLVTLQSIDLSAQFTRRTELEAFVQLVGNTLDLHADDTELGIAFRQLLRSTL